MNLILLYVMVGLGFVGLVVQRSKVVTVATYFFTWTLMWTKHTADYYAYYTIYNSTHEFRDGGYKILCMMGQMMGLSFFEFFMALGAIGFAIYCWFTLKYAYKHSLVAALYMLSISLFDIVQFRNFLAFAIILLFLPNLFKPTRNGIAYYVLGVLLAATIHLTMIFYLSFVFMNTGWFNAQNLKRIILPLLLLAVAFIIGSEYYLDKAENLMGLYNKKISDLTKWAVGIMLVGNVVFIYLWQRTQIRLELDEPQKEFALSKGNVVTLMNAALICLFPVALQSMTVMRLYKYMAIVNYSFISCHMANFSNWRLIPQTFIVGLYSLTYLGLFVVLHGIYFIRGVAKPIFTTNCFWNHIQDFF